MRTIKEDDKITGGYFHCGKCVEEKKRPNLECGWTKKGFQVRCFTHDQNLIHIDFMGQKIRTI